MTNANCNTQVVSASFKKLVFTNLLTVWVGGCATTQRVAYSVENVPRATDSPVAHVRLMIGPLKDVRRTVTGNEILFSSPNETTINNEAYCINAEEGYRPNSVAAQISEMLATHLRQRASLRAVSVGGPTEGAFYLSGTLNRYYGAQKSTSTSTSTVVLFGAIGAAVAAAATPDETPGMVSIEIVDVVLHDSAGKPIVTLPNIQSSKKLSLRAATDCLVVYDNVNEQLRRIFDEYAYAIEGAIANVDTGNQAPAVASVPTVAQPPAVASTPPAELPAAVVAAQPVVQPPVADSTKADEQPPDEPW